MDLFTLVGKITIDCKEAEEKIDALMQKADTLAGKLGGGSSTSPTTGSTSITPSTTPSTPTKSGNNTILPISNATVAAGTFAWKKIVDYIGNLISVGTERNEDMEVYTKSYQTKLDISSEEAEEFTNSLKEFAKNTPLSFNSVMMAADQLLSVGTPMEEVIERLTVLGNNIMGVDSKLFKATKAWTDISGYDQLNAQETRQLVENGVFIRELLENSIFGKDATMEGFASGLQYINDVIQPKTDYSTYQPTTNEELEEYRNTIINDMLTAHDITENEVWNALVWAQEYGSFKNAMANMMDTAQGAEEKAEDAFIDFAAQNTKWFTNLKKWYNQTKTDMFERNVRRTEEFFNDPATTTEMQKVMDVVDALTAPTPTLQDYLNEQNYKNYAPDWQGPILQQGDTISRLEGVMTRLEATLDGKTIEKAVKDGMSGVTITTGSVTLNDGVLVGRLLPRINIGLGLQAARDARG